MAANNEEPTHGGAEAVDEALTQRIDRIRGGIQVLLDLGVPLSQILEKLGPRRAGIAIESPDDEPPLC